MRHLLLPVRCSEHTSRVEREWGSVTGRPPIEFGATVLVHGKGQVARLREDECGWVTFFLSDQVHPGAGDLRTCVQRK